MNSKEELEIEYQRISFWISNIDTKISFALGASGVLLGFIFSNEEFPKILKKHLKSIEFWNNSATLIVFFGLTVILLALTMWCFLNGLRAKIDPKKYHQSQMISPSNIFWGDISKDSFYTYKYRLENSRITDWEKDMQTQIYINSCICQQKTTLYNIGITCLKISLIAFILYHLWLWFVI